MKTVNLFQEVTMYAIFTRYRADHRPGSSRSSPGIEPMISAPESRHHKHLIISKQQHIYKSPEK